MTTWISRPVSLADVTPRAKGGIASLPISLDRPDVCYRRIARPWGQAIAAGRGRSGAQVEGIDIGDDDDDGNRYSRLPAWTLKQGTHEPAQQA